MKRLEEKLLQRSRTGQLRVLNAGDLAIDFYSNDYLGLARSESLREQVTKNSLLSTDFKRQNGSTGSRLLSGNNNYFLHTEQFLSKLFNSEKTLIFNSGYNANLAILSSVPQKGDTILYDELIHTSVKDGARLSFAKRLSFKHNNLIDLKTKLQKSEGEKFVVVESVYSMDGDSSPLIDLAELCAQHHAHLIVDEAHSTGIWGKKGSGLCTHLEIEKKIFARIYTFGKAIGSHGACISGSAILVDYLINFARPFIYTTSLPLHSIVAIRSAFQLIGENPSLISILHDRIAFFKNLVKEKNLHADDFEFIESISPIQVIKISGTDQVKLMADTIRLKGIDVRPILSPTVKEGEERLRICLHSFNTNEEIEYLVNSLSESSKIKSSN